MAPDFQCFGGFMKRAITTGVLMLGALCAGFAAQAEEATALKKPEASIPFANQRTGIRDWQADGTQGLWVQDVHRKWYYATLLGPCIGLDFAQSIGFETRATSTLDKFALIVVPDEGRCQFTSFTKSDGPPPKKAKKSKAEKEAEKDAAKTEAKTE